MIKFVLALATMLCVGALSAQEPYKVFCTISGTSYLKTASSRIELNYGQENTHRSWLVDENGKELELKSVPAVANYLSKLGWEFENSDTWGEDSRHYVWIMSKMVTNDSQITEGFTTALMYQESEKK